ncbi:hypothetical protein ANN_19338 [Periplaneta americana]|uniref:Uncharacterized protein n=1 Tax=Periplaneta americana TaxID=6978 RepID=A0ABQ8SAL2_PERAM|nr:hypothetical protein ANN_19338 [Periplaneta americana]
MAGLCKGAMNLNQSLCCPPSHECNINGSGSVHSSTSSGGGSGGDSDGGGGGGGSSSSNSGGRMSSSSSNIDGFSGVMLVAAVVVVVLAAEKVAVEAVLVYTTVAVRLFSVCKQFIRVDQVWSGKVKKRLKKKGKLQLDALDKAKQCRTELARDVTLHHRTGSGGLLVERFSAVNLFVSKQEPKLPILSVTYELSWRGFVLVCAIRSTVSYCFKRFRF